MASLLVLFYIFSALTIAFSDFIPKDNFLIDCGADKAVPLMDGRSFIIEDQANQFLQTKDEIKVSVEKAPVSSPIYLTGMIFLRKAIYKFHLSQPGWHWVRLHFYPLKTPKFDLNKATFSVSTEKYVLLHSFNMNNTTDVLKEYILNLTEKTFSIKFIPKKNSAAFINAIEVVSAPRNWVADAVIDISHERMYSSLLSFAYETWYRLNVGGPTLTSVNDSLGRTWTSDDSYLQSKELSKSVSVWPSIVNDPAGLIPLFGPLPLYASAVEMAEAQESNSRSNVTWNFEADPAFGYLIRLHFCDFVSKALGDFRFNVYINGKLALSNLDLSRYSENQLGVPIFRDVLLGPPILSDELTIQIGPSNLDKQYFNAILNGLEVWKISNSLDSLDGEFGVDGIKVVAGANTRTTVAIIGIAVMFAGLVSLGAYFYFKK